jgi:hypothetical protein
MGIGKWRTDESRLDEIMWPSHPNNKDTLTPFWQRAKTLATGN